MQTTEYRRDLAALHLPTLQWHPLPALHHQYGARTGHVAEAYNGCMWVFGGFSQTPDRSKVLSNSLFCFNFETEVWDFVDMVVRRTGRGRGVRRS